MFCSQDTVAEYSTNISIKLVDLDALYYILDTC